MLSQGAHADIQHMVQNGVVVRQLLQPGDQIVSTPQARGVGRIEEAPFAQVSALEQQTRKGAVPLAFPWFPP